MKSIVKTAVLTFVFITGFGHVMDDSAYGAGTVFLCETVNDVPTTVAYSPQLIEPIEIVRWQPSNWFEGAPPEFIFFFPAERRCQEVAERLQTYYACGFLAEFLNVENGSTSPFLVEEIAVSWTEVLFPVVYVRLPSQQDNNYCSSQRTADGKLLLFMLEPGTDTSNIVEQLEGIRRGIGEPIISGSGMGMN
jgi:hypothetical protein